MTAPSDVELQQLARRRRRPLGRPGLRRSSRPSPAPAAGSPRPAPTCPAVRAGSWAGWSPMRTPLKVAILGVPDDAPGEHGAVSEPVVRAMAAGRAGSHSAAPSASPSAAWPARTAAPPDKPVGTVWLAWGRREPDGASRIEARCERFAGRPGRRAALDGPARAGAAARPMSDRLFFALWPDAAAAAGPA